MLLLLLILLLLLVLLSIKQFLFKTSLRVFISIKYTLSHLVVLFCR